MSSKQEILTQLRQRAERSLNKSPDQQDVPPQDDRDLVHELRVHQTELDIQMEDLQHSYHLIDVAHKQYMALFDFAPIAYIVTDAHGIVVNANLAAGSLLQTNRAELIGIPLAGFIAPADQDVYHLHRRAVLHLKQNQTGELRLRKADGSLLYVQLTTNLSDEPTGTLFTAITDLTARRQMEEVLQRTLEQEHELSQLRARVMGVISHEFRTPLTVILSAVETLERYSDKMPPEDKQRRYQTIRNMVWYLNNTVQDARTIALPEEPPETKPESFDLAHFLQPVIEAMGLLAKDGQKIVLERVGGAEIEYVTWDVQQARRMLMNLLSNALHYSEQDVHCRVEFRPDRIRVHISDRGIGIPADDLPHIYEAFYRGGNVLTVPGAGIGLTVVQRAVRALGGTIRCESRLNEGTTFTVEIPREQPDPAIP